MSHPTRIAIATHNDVVVRWVRQYGDSPDPGKQAITAKLKALVDPTKAEIDAIVGNESWTSIFCSSCMTYVSHAAEFGSDYTSHVCVECLTATLRDLRAEIGKDGGG